MGSFMSVRIMRPVTSYLQIDNYQAMKEVAEYISKKGCNGSD